MSRTTRKIIDTGFNERVEKLQRFRDYSRGDKGFLDRKVNQYGIETASTLLGINGTSFTERRMQLVSLVRELPVSLAFWWTCTRGDASLQYCEVVISSGNKTRIIRLAPDHVHIISGEQIDIHLINKKSSIITPVTITNIDYYCSETTAPPSWIEE